MRRLSTRFRLMLHGRRFAEPLLAAFAALTLLVAVLILPKSASVAGGPRPGRGAGKVPILIQKTHAESMKLGGAAQLLLVVSAPVAETRTSECTGTDGSYPVQPVLVMDRTNTYLTDTIACTPAGLKSGEILIPTASEPETRAGDHLVYSRFLASPL